MPASAPPPVFFGVNNRAGKVSGFPWADDELDLQGLVEAIRFIAGGKLDSVVLYGSAVWGEWDFDASDIDVAVLLDMSDMGPDLGPRQKSCGDIYGELFDLRSREEFGPLARRLEFFVDDAERVFGLCDFAPCMESKILSDGAALWVAPEWRQYPSLPVAEARARVVERGMGAAGRIIDGGRYKLAATEIQSRLQPERLASYGYEYSHACADAHAAGCFALRAMLYQHDIDPSDRALRWRAGELLARLITVTPASARLSAAAAALPDSYDRDLIEFDADKAAARSAIAAAIRIYRFARRELDVGAGKLLPVVRVREMADKFANILSGGDSK